MELEGDQIDLTPRPTEPEPARKRKPWAAVGVVVVLGALGFVVFQGLTNAALYFRNADAAVAERDDLGDRRFRLQGTVVADTVETRGDAVFFEVAHNDVSAPVRHVGDPPELFQPGIPVVLEGRWSESDAWFESDRILVKHTSEYEAENPDRVDEYDDADTGGAANTGGADDDPVSDSTEEG